MTSTASASSATRQLANLLSAQTASRQTIRPVAAPSRPVAALASSNPAQAAAISRLATQVASAPGASVVLQKAGAAYEATGSKTVSVGAGITSATESLELRAGGSYTVTSSFGLSSSRGSMKLELLESKGKVVQSALSGVGKTSAKLDYKATTDGAFTLRLTGQPIDKTSTTQIYQNYSIAVTQAASKIPTSGDKNIDALVFGGTNSWLHDAGAAATLSNDVVKDGVRSLTGALSRTVKYAFATEDSVKNLTGEDARGAAVMSAVQKAAVNDALSYFSSVIALRFEAVSDPAQADIVFGQNRQGGTSAGYANAPNQSGSHAEYLFLASDQSTNGTFTKGSYGLTTLMHEIGHTLGLKHPGNYNAGGGGAPGPYVPKATDNRRFSIMSYYGAPGVSANPQTLMSYDILALQFLYGANKNTADPAALAKNQTTTFDDAWSGLETIWAPKGAELDASKTTSRNIIDAREGAYSSVAMAGATATNNVGLAWGSKLAAAKGGKGDDAIYTAATGDILVDGGAGADTLYLAGKAAEWSKTGDAYTRKIAGKVVATVTARNVESLAYYDAAKMSLTHV